MTAGRRKHGRREVEVQLVDVVVVDLVRILRSPAAITSNGPAPLDAHVDEFGNIQTRTLAPAGILTLLTSFVIADSGLPDEVARGAREVPVSQLPDDVTGFLHGSRYCETDRLSALAWSLFGGTPRGWARVQSIVDYVHQRLTFGYRFARSTRTAFEGNEERVGVCRDFAHLAIALCRSMNIPARYATGYLGDAADCAITTTFGSSKLVQFDIVTEEVSRVSHAA